MLISPCYPGTRDKPQMRRRSCAAADKAVVSLPPVNGIAYPTPPETSAAERHNPTDIEASEPDRHADMAARKAQALVEALRIDAGVMGQQLHQLAAAIASLGKRPLHQLLADPLAPAMRGDA